MNRTHRGILTALACSAILLLPTPAPSIEGDDQFLLTTSVAPNVVLLFDNSDSMSQIEWHPAFDVDVDPACDAFDDDVLYSASADLTSEETHCDNTRTLFDPAQNDAKTPEAFWLGRYLNWYFSDAADAYVDEIENAVVADLGCNKTSEYPDKYRRTRGQAAKETMLTVLCVAEALDVRFGLAKFRERLDAESVDPNGGFVSVELRRANPSHAAELESSIKNSIMGSSTPLAESLFQIYTYFMSRTTADIPFGRDGATRFPKYQYAKDGDWETNSNNWLDDAVEVACQKNYVVIVTDGLPKHDNFDQDPADTAHGFDAFTDLIGDYHADGETEVLGDDDESTRYLDDIAKYMQDVDFRPDFDDDQVIDVYTVGFATDDATNTFLQKTADVANGLFFHAKDGEELALALVAALNDIIEKSRSFTAATVPSARTQSGGDFYNSFFLPSGNSAFWQGHLRAWHIDALGDIYDANGSCALVDPDPGECNSGVFKPACADPLNPDPDCAVPFWDAGAEIPAPGARELLVSKPVAGTPDMLAFDDALTAQDLTIAPFVVPSDPAPNSALYPVKGSSAINAEGLADEVVAYARGCAFGTGVETADVSDGAPCAARTWLLGDIFHSNPIVVAHPRQLILEPSYHAFQEYYRARRRVIYAGTNAGFLEAFHAGTYDVATGEYDEGTGAELFGFMPWQSRRKIKNLPVDFPTSRTHYVDGSTQAADVWWYPSDVTSSKAADGSEWRSLLVGSMRGGGSQYFALDVTNPEGISQPDGGSPLPYPGYLWEFPPEGDLSSDPAYMGETWGTPILTRVRVKKAGNAGPDGLGFERWVAIVTGGYHASGDPNPETVSGHLPTYVPAATAGRAIFILDVQTGEVLAQKKFNPVGSNCPAGDAASPQQNMCFAIPSTPSVLDLDFDGFADVILVGDLGGNLWKWVIHPIGEDRVNDSSSLRTQPSWTFRRLFKAPVAVIGGESFYKNFFFPPAATYVGSTLWLTFASGERLHVGFTGIPDEDENNRFYSFTDLDPYENAGLPTLTEADLTDVTGNEGESSFATRGFFFKGADGEKFVTNIQIFQGTVIAGSFTPTPSGDTCTSRGEGTLYAFNVTNGGGEFRDDADNPERGLAIGAGLPTDPKISIGAGGKNTRVIIEKSGADFESIEGDDVNVGGRILYWRERQ